MVAETTAHESRERSAFVEGDALAAPRGDVVARPGDEPFAAAPFVDESRRPTAIRRVRASVALALAREYERGTGFVLIPVAFGTGAALNFSLARDPDLVAAGLLGLLALAATILSADRPVLRALSAAALVFALGLLAASFETWRAGTPMLGADITTRITGRVVLIEDRADLRPRITIDVIATERPQLRHAPARIRVTTREIPAGLRAGQEVAGVVRLLPPTGPVRPFSYDFSFESYFDRIGASGFFLAGPYPGRQPAAAGPVDRLLAWIENARLAMAGHIRARISGAEGEIAAALVAGVRSGIPEEVDEALRRTGLAHFLSISGLHMALVAGTVVGALRAAFALFPGFASRRPVKKYAAAVALAVLSVYLAISGADVAAQRSYIMFAVMLVAVLFDRAALTMRNLAIAAIIVLAIAPHEIMGPSFQMSFAATAALISAYGWYAERRRRDAAAVQGRERSLPRRAARLGLLFLGGLAMTSLIAGTATGLYAAWHFQRVAPLGLVANLLAMPVVSVAVMPAAVAGTVLAPLGLDGPFFTIMGWGLSWVIAVAEWVAARSPLDAVGLVPPSAVVVLSVALVLLTVATTWLRVTAVPLLAAGIALIAMRELPDALLDEDGRLVAMRMTEGRLAVNRTRPSSFTMENWGRALAAEKTVRPAKGTLAEGGGEQPFFCADDLCLARRASGAVIATAPNAEAAARACAIAALIVIDDATARNPCRRGDAVRVVTRKDLARRGSAAVHFAQDGEAQVIFAIGDGERPWHYQRRFSRAARGLPPYQRKKKDETAADMPQEGKSATPPALGKPDDAADTSPAGDVAARAEAAGKAAALPVGQ